jgi:hypothetical protein
VFITVSNDCCGCSRAYSRQCIERLHPRCIDVDGAAAKWLINARSGLDEADRFAFNRHVDALAVFNQRSKVNPVCIGVSQSATSGSYGSPFSKDGNYHHLIHPLTGQPSTRWKSLSVIAPTATQADALSTGLSFASATEIAQIGRTQPELRVLTQG